MGGAAGRRAIAASGEDQGEANHKGGCQRPSPITAGTGAFDQRLVPALGEEGGVRLDSCCATPTGDPPPSENTFRRHQQVEDGMDVPGPMAASSTNPSSDDRRIAPRCTTYHTPRQEIIDAMPKDRV